MKRKSQAETNFINETQKISTVKYFMQLNISYDYKSYALYLNVNGLKHGYFLEYYLQKS